MPLKMNSNPAARLLEVSSNAIQAAAAPLSADAPTPDGARVAERSVKPVRQPSPWKRPSQARYP